MSDPAKYLRYLPAPYSTPAVPGAAKHLFLGEYLKVFEKLLTGRDGAQLEAVTGFDKDLAQRKGIQELLADNVIGSLFHPRLTFLFEGSDDGHFLPAISSPQPNAAVLALLSGFFGRSASSPDTNAILASYRVAAAQSAPSAIERWLSGYLDWLGRCVAMSGDQNWAIDKKRWVIAQAMALYRLRGTQQGMQWLLDLWFDLPIDGAAQQPWVSAPPSMTVTVSNPVRNPLFIWDSVAQQGMLRGVELPPNPPLFKLADVYTRDLPVISDIVSQQLKLTDEANDFGGQSIAAGDSLWVAYMPWLFDLDFSFLDKNHKPIDAIFMLYDEQKIENAQVFTKNVKALVDQAKPIGTRYAVTGTAFELAKIDGSHNMSDANLTQCLNYTDGMFLTAAGMQTEHKFFADRFAYLIKSLLTQGLISGLTVKAGANSRSIEVSPGAAIDNQGRMLYYPGTDGASIGIDPEILAADKPCYVQMQWQSVPLGDVTDVTAKPAVVASMSVGAVKIATLTITGGEVSHVSQASGDVDVPSVKTWSPQPF